MPIISKVRLMEIVRHYRRLCRDNARRLVARVDPFTLLDDIRTYDPDVPPLIRVQVLDRIQVSSGMATRDKFGPSEYGAADLRSIDLGINWDDFQPCPVTIIVAACHRAPKFCRFGEELDSDCKPKYTYLGLVAGCNFWDAQYLGHEASTTATLSAKQYSRLMEILALYKEDPMAAVPFRIVINKNRVARVIEY